MTWDTETERRVDEALSVVNRRPRLRLVDHHPWEAPPFPPGHRRFAWNVGAVLRWIRVLVGLALALDLVAHASRSGGWGRLGLLAAAVAVIAVSVVSGRGPG